MSAGVERRLLALDLVGGAQAWVAVDARHVFLEGTGPGLDVDDRDTPPGPGPGRLQEGQPLLVRQQRHLQPTACRLRRGEVPDYKELIMWIPGEVLEGGQSFGWYLEGIPATQIIDKMKRGILWGRPTVALVTLRSSAAKSSCSVTKDAPSWAAARQPRRLW